MRVLKQFLAVVLIGGTIGTAAADDPDVSFENFLPTGRRQYVNNPKLNATEWPRSVRIADPLYERETCAESEPLSADPVFGSAYFAGTAGFVTAGCPELAQAPLTVRLRVKVASADQFNIFTAFQPKASPLHWELYTFRGDGDLSFYMPGNQPDTIRSNPCITDGQWHDVAAVVTRQRVVLYVDGKQVADGPVTRRPTRILRVSPTGCFPAGVSNQRSNPASSLPRTYRQSPAPRSNWTTRSGAST